MECFTAVHTEIYLSVVDNWHFPAGKTEFTTAVSNLYRLSLETKAPSLDKLQRMGSLVFHVLNVSFLVINYVFHVCLALLLLINIPPSTLQIS